MRRLRARLVPLPRSSTRDPLPVHEEGRVDDPLAAALPTPIDPADPVVGTALLPTAAAVFSWSRTLRPPEACGKRESSAPLIQSDDSRARAHDESPAELLPA